jgi:hypothetical protein
MLGAGSGITASQDQIDDTSVDLQVPVACSAQQRLQRMRQVFNWRQIQQASSALKGVKRQQTRLSEIIFLY